MNILPGLMSAGKPRTRLVQSVHDDSLWQGEDNLSCLVIIDKSVEGHPSTAVVRDHLERRGPTRIKVVQGGELAKLDSFALDIAANAAADHLVVIGGGAVLNLGTFLAAEPLKAKVKTLWLVPTTTMAIADVAIGGLGLLNDGDGRKNAVHVRRDPDLIVADISFLEGAPVEVCREGVVETIKHAILQRTDRLRPLLELFLSPHPDVRECYDAALEGASLKADLLRRIPETPAATIEFLFSYGHLAGHAVEEASEGSVSHGTAVSFGLLVELMLCNESDLAQLFIESFRKSCARETFLDQVLRQERVEDYLARLPSEGRSVVKPGWYRILELGEAAGRFDKLKPLKLSFRTVSTEQIRRSFNEAIELLR